MISKGFAAVLSLLFATCTSAGGMVHEFKLDNGLKLLVREDHRAPVVVSQVWYKVGSSYEHDGITGISHVLEHLMFKGTKNHKPGEFSRIIAENGGRENAFTSRDYTAYFQTLEKDRLPISFELEADRMRNLVFDEKEAEKEIRVVMEERRLRTEDNPQALTYERFNAIAFLSSPYRTPVIGWMNDLENLTVADLQGWYQRWYAPNNATVVVAGDVDPDHVLALAKKYFGPLKPSTITADKPRTEFEQRDTRRIRVRAPATVPYLLLGYKVPVLLNDRDSAEPYALEVLAGALDGGSSARLTRNLVRGSQIAASAGAGYDPNDRQESVFLLDGTPAPGQAITALETALYAEVEKLRTEEISPTELARVKAQVVADHVYQQDSQFYQAMELGSLESVGLGWRTRDQYLKGIDEVTAAQVRAVAKKYLRPDRLTVAELDPLPIDAVTARRQAAGGGMNHVR